MLKVDFSALAANRRLQVFGNLPYNISTPILFHLLDHVTVIDDMCFMLQEEVVDRIVAEPNTSDYGRLTVMLQYRCEVEKLFTVPPTAFKPPPKVYSAMIRLVPKSKETQLDVDHEILSQLVNVAFQQRRKTIRNSLKSLINQEAFTTLGLDPKARAENLSVNDYVQLANYVRAEKNK